jgi:CheY-like chemotaxis protein
MIASPIKSILVVDDSRVARMLIRNIILGIHSHWIIKEAANGKEAVEHASLETPNYITMDYNMPDMDGIEASQQILQHTPKTVIVLFTSNVQSHTRELAENLGIGFVGKPITEATVRQALAFFADRS